MTVGPQTRARYEAARKKFYAFLRLEGMSLPTSRSQLDPILAEYIEFLWSSGEGRGLAADTVAGLQDLDPKLRGNLQATWRLLRTWNVNEVPNRAPPFPVAVVEALIGYAFFHKNIAFAVSILVGFYGMLRTGEILELTSESLHMNGPRSPIVISLGMTKSGKRSGAAESATIYVQQVQQLVWLWKQQVPARCPLVDSHYQWRQFFHQALTSLQLLDYGFRPYSLRRGGATMWFRKHGSFDKLLVAGRWKAAATARIYLNEGMALLAELKIPPSHLHPFRAIFQKATPAQWQKLEQTLKTKGPKGRSGGRGKHKKQVQNGGWGAAANFIFLVIST